MLRELKQPQTAKMIDQVQAPGMLVNASVKTKTVPAEITGQRVPSTKRVRTFQRNVEKARKAITAGLIQPKTREVAEHCQCANRTALSILTELTKLDVLKRSGRGWVVA